MPTSHDPDELLDRRQLAQRLKLTVRGVDGLVKRKLLTCIRLGRKCLRFRWADVEADIARLKTLSIGAEIDARKKRTRL